MNEDITEELIDIVRLSGVPLGSMFAEFVEQVGYERVKYMHNSEFIKSLENFYTSL